MYYYYPSTSLLVAQAFTALESKTGINTSLYTTDNHWGLAHIYTCCCFLFLLPFPSFWPWGTHFRISISFTVDLMMNSLHFCLSENVFNSPSFSKGIFITWATCFLSRPLSSQFLLLLLRSQPTTCCSVPKLSCLHWLLAGLTLHLVYKGFIWWVYTWFSLYWPHLRCTASPSYVLLSTCESSFSHPQFSFCPSLSSYLQLHIDFSPHPQSLFSLNSLHLFHHPPSLPFGNAPFILWIYESISVFVF